MDGWCSGLPRICALKRPSRPTTSSVHTLQSLHNAETEVQRQKLSGVAVLRIILDEILDSGYTNLICSTSCSTTTDTCCALHACWIPNPK
jgi:hypothetical protein